MKALVVLVVFFAVALSETNAGDMECATAHGTCASYLADAANSDCTKKDPYFKCLRDSGCSTDDAAYKASAVVLDYNKCISGDSGNDNPDNTLECATAHSTCALKLADAANPDCTKKEPYFKCLRDSGCSTDDAAYKASAVAFDYNKCTNSNNGVAVPAITWMFPLVMLVMSKTFCD